MFVKEKPLRRRQLISPELSYRNISMFFNVWVAPMLFDKIKSSNLIKQDIPMRQKCFLTYSGL